MSFEQLALSGTSDALADLYWHNSVALTWGQLLVTSGSVPLMAREAPCVSEIWNDLLAHENMSRVSQNGLFAPFIYKMHHFTKTGSGQTEGKL